MTKFSPAELARMELAQTGAMQDKCIIMVYSAEDGDYGPSMDYPTYTAGDPVVCGYKPTSKEVMDGSQVAMTDGKLRLPIGTDVSHLDRIRLTHRFGVALSTPETFEILGQPERGPSGLVLNLRMVTDGSDA